MKKEARGPQFHLAVTLVRPAGSLFKLQPTTATAGRDFALQMLSVISIHLNKTVATKAEHVYQFLLAKFFKNFT
jgi:hypothetical protein